ncbi:MAG: WD40 repeat domain-containing protein [Saprospiraceae bacterium]|nr:WD40 repeat domain-containing protein [Saprospiraceae bacterium]
MRNFLIFLLLAIAEILPAQNYLQNAPPAQQTKAPEDCYTRLLDNGNAALRRGEPRVALRYFNDAKNCPDAQGNSRRQSELDARITRCNNELGIVNTASGPKKNNATPASRKRSFTSETSNARRHYAANRDFLKDTIEHCFERMSEEADRAFRLRFWEDAAALYRAAKNCADADQNDRQRMSERITACRDAAENELFAKQQEAERRARHAIASNMADDALELLQTTDRSIAFRLADFANQYVAPDDNPECVQAMFDAWYYQPADDIKHQLDELYRPALCYELADNLGENTQIRYQQQRDGQQWLWAFVPKTGDMFAWEMPSMKIVQSFGTGEANSYTGFDFSPAGDLLFLGNNFFELRRNARVHRVDVATPGAWCFSERGDEFFFQNVGRQSIYILNVREALAQQSRSKGNKNANTFQIPVVEREIVTGVTEQLLAIQYFKGKFWLGYRDRIEVLSKPAPGQSWKKEKVIRFEQNESTQIHEFRDLRLEIYPKEGFAVLGYFGGATIVSLDDAAGKPAFRQMNECFPLAISPTLHQLAVQHVGNYQHNAFWLFDAFTGDTLIRQRIPGFTNFDLMKGAFSPDSRWAAATSYMGNICVWALKDEPTVRTASFPINLLENPDCHFNSDGALLINYFRDTLAVYQTDEPDSPPRFFKNFQQVIRGSSDDWVLVHTAATSCVALRLEDGKSVSIPCLDPPYGLFAVDEPSEKLIAYLTDKNKVELRSLENGALITHRVFEGGPIAELHFIPGSQDLLVVQHNSNSRVDAERSSVKIWSPLRAGLKPHALRMHDYLVREMSLDRNGQRVAFSNGNDIRLYEFVSPENEMLKIRPIKDKLVNAIAFIPGSSLIAAAYTGGKIIFWDAVTGELKLQWQAVPQDGLIEFIVEIRDIAVSADGAILHIITTDGRMYSYAIDPTDIRNAAQDEHRHLQSFDIEQIQRYNLEVALNYPGNFERLAESGDGPLLSSFFRYFQWQALESNNIERVKLYCERSYFLFERLDANTQETWRNDVQLMYQDYAQKLMMRSSLSEAAKVLDFLEKQFGNRPTLMDAHMALLKKDYSKASQLYTRYLLKDEGSLSLDFLVRWSFEQVEKDMLQMISYELLDSTQINCFCSTVRYSGSFANVCPNGAGYPDNILSATDRTRWEIFEMHRAADELHHFAARSRLLTKAYQQAKELARQNPAADQTWQENTLLSLAAIHYAWAKFEGNSAAALQQYEQTAHLLAEHGPLKKLADTSRLSLLTTAYWKWGAQLLKGGNAAEALPKLETALNTARALSVAVAQADTNLLVGYYDNLVGPVYRDMGTAYLLSGRPTEARQAYELANAYFYSTGLNSLYTAGVALFEGDQTQASLDYGGIYHASQTAEAVYMIDCLSERFPEKKAALQNYIPTLYGGLRSRNRALVNNETTFWLAQLKTTRFALQARWDSAVWWTRVAMQQAEYYAKQTNADPTWQNNWIGEHINLPYYLLLSGWNKPEALEECMRIAEAAETYLKDKEDSYQYKGLIKTNLAHALVLRNKPGDRDRAIELYKTFLSSYNSPEGYDNLDILEKDFRDLKNAGAPWPELRLQERIEE